MSWAPVILESERVRLVPVDAAAHADALFAAASPDTFRYFLSWPEPWTRESFRAWLAPFVEHACRLPFAVIDRSSGAIVGSTAFLDIDDENRTVEIGATWYAPAARGTHVNPECKLLMLRHAFERMGRVRVTLKCDARNIRSRRAIAGIGASFEGILRRHLTLADGHVRDTAMFSVIDGDWARVRALLERRLREPRGGAGFTVRDAAMGDLPAVLPLVRELCAMHDTLDAERFAVRPDVLDRYAEWLPERIRDPRSVFLVAESSGEIVGHLVGTIEPEVPIFWTPESAWIHDIFVLPGRRGRGVGAALVRAAIDRFGALGAARIRLETAAANEGARALFRASGFRHSTTEMLMTLDRAPLDAVRSGPASMEAP